MPGIYGVDLLTRQLDYPDVYWCYGELTEMLSSWNSDCLTDEMGESSGAYILRIPLWRFEVSAQLEGSFVVN
ncbi:sucrose-phosphate synthase [Artemisia annua]|uniref:Sucrose-phosphate synthase n=1 Tax=Artemisia annua TaxID=35608 RepID=A0A2U1NMU2_ARTAN|nr:sucrose-phosphate synthase [Artemisia annua]